MQRIINDPNLVVEEMLKGFAKCHQNLVAPIEENPRVLKYIKAPIQGKVGVVTGGGSGHKPAFIGYIGKNMCDAVAVGEVFTSPSAQAFLDAFKAANGGAVRRLFVWQLCGRQHERENGEAARGLGSH
jgi:dihydroxyacetone kinase-like protein